MDHRRFPDLPVDLLQRGADDFDGEEFEKLVANVERRIEYQVPASKYVRSWQDEINECLEADRKNTFVMAAIKDRDYHEICRG